MAWLTAHATRRFLKRQWRWVLLTNESHLTFFFFFLPRPRREHTLREKELEVVLLWSGQAFLMVKSHS